MTLLTKRISRVTPAKRRDRGQDRNIVVSFIPPAYVGLRLSGRVQTFLLDIEVAYELATHQLVRDIEREARRIQKTTHCRMASARKQAERSIRAEVAGIVRASRPARPVKLDPRARYNLNTRSGTALFTHAELLAFVEANPKYPLSEVAKLKVGEQITYKLTSGLAIVSRNNDACCVYHMNGGAAKSCRLPKKENQK